MRRHSIHALLIVILLLEAAYVGAASSALETVKGRVGQVLDLLRDPSLKGPAGEMSKRERIRAVSEKMFDYLELSRRTLGPHWNKFMPEQQLEFVELYKSILEGAYIDKIMSYTDEKILYHRENPLTEKTVEVQTTVVTKKADIPISYRLIQKAGDWKVYDVVIEGVSLVGNYRTQFSRMLANDSPVGFLESLRKRSSTS